jgi:hypothetical protein
MSIGLTLLGLLERGPWHGYDLKRAYDERFGQDRPLHYGQVYSTLARLLKNGLVEADGTRRRRAGAQAVRDHRPPGVTDVERTGSPRPRSPSSTCRTRSTRRSSSPCCPAGAPEVLDIQRAAHLRTMRELTRRKNDGDLADQLICDHALFHLEADLRWLELTAARLDQLAKEVRWHEHASAGSDRPAQDLRDHPGTGRGRPAIDAGEVVA